MLFTTAGQLLGDLAALDSDLELRRMLRHCVNPTLLVIDEVGYISSSNRHADLLFELISRCYEHKGTLGNQRSSVRRRRGSSPPRPASPPCSVASSITPRSSQSRRILTASRRQPNTPRS